MMSFNIETLDLILGNGRNKKSDTATEYTSSGSIYRTYKPTIAPAVVAWFTAAALGCAASAHAFAGDTRAVPPKPVVDQPAKAPARVAVPQAVGAIVRVYRDSVPWFGENRDVASLESLGKVQGSDLFIHPLSDLALGIPAGTAVVLISSNGQGDPSASVTQNSRAAQRSLAAFVRRGGVLIVDMGDNDSTGGYMAPGATGTPDLVFPEPCEDATLGPAAKGKDGVLGGPADDHPIVNGPDRRPGTADDLNDANIDMPPCAVAHGNLEQGITLPKGAKVLMTATFGGEQRTILAEYGFNRGRVILDTITKEFEGHQPPGVGPSLFMRSLFAYALQRAKKLGA
jgi:hypothetical protein